MPEIIRLKNSHTHGYTKPIVCTKGSSLSLDPFTVDPCLDRVLLKIMHRVRILLRYHIDVALKDDTLHVLTSRSRRLAYHNVPYLVLNGLKSMGLTPIIHILDSLGLFLGRARYLSQSIKVLPHYLWVKILYHIQ